MVLVGSPQEIEFPPEIDPAVAAGEFQDAVAQEEVHQLIDR
jgi:hypothetical protein